MRIIFVLCLGFLLLLASSAERASAGETTDMLTVTQVKTGWGAEGIYVVTKEKQIVAGCELARYHMRADHPMLQENLSLIMTAFMAGMKVQFYVGGCKGDNMEINAVTVLSDN